MVPEADLTRASVQLQLTIQSLRYDDRLGNETETRFQMIVTPSVEVTPALHK
jgi:hypothetical protein